MTDIGATGPIAEAELEALLQTAWASVREEPGLSTYVPAKERIERALMFRLGVHLNSLVVQLRKTWPLPWRDVTVDSELHRAHDGPKLTGTEVPDLLVHVRGQDDMNLLAIEAKHGDGPDAGDQSKLCRLRDKRAYRFVWAVRFDLNEPLVIQTLATSECSASPPTGRRARGAR